MVAVVLPLSSVDVRIGDCIGAIVDELPAQDAGLPPLDTDMPLPPPPDPLLLLPLSTSGSTRQRYLPIDCTRRARHQIRPASANSNRAATANAITQFHSAEPSPASGSSSKRRSIQSGHTRVA